MWFFGVEWVMGGLCFICVNCMVLGEIFCIELGLFLFGEFGWLVGEWLCVVVELFMWVGVCC